MTIVRNTEWLLRQPILKIDERLLANLRNRRTGRSLLPAVTLFEAYLQVAQESPVTVESFRGPESDRLIERFVGALHSSRFIEASLRMRYVWAADFLEFAAVVGLSPALTRQSLSTTFIADGVAIWRDRFDSLALDDDQIWLKNAWGCKNKAGASICFPLYPVYERLGKHFTQQFATVLEVWAVGRRDSRIKVLSDFCRFFSDYTEVISTDLLHDQYWTNRFLSDFGRYYFKSTKARGASVKNAARGWNSTFIPIVDALVKSRALAQPEPPMAPITAVRVTSKGSETNIRKSASGVEVKVNLLTEIPLAVTDSEAKEILFKNIQEDFAACLTWAEKEADDLWKRHVRARDLAPSGKVRTKGEVLVAVGSSWLTHPDNPDCLANCAATYAQHGHPSPGSAAFYAQVGYQRAAHMLGIPINGSLLPHASLLVANYPAITSAFLDTLELFDREGKISGLIEEDAGKYLVGYKRRKGAKLAEQRFLLNRRAAELVEQVIELTTPLRTYLRACGNDAWRYLFLTVEGIGATPKRQRFSDQCSAPHKWGIHGLLASFTERAAIDSAVAADLVRHFSLKNLRGSAALIIYLQTGDAQKMSEALGHTTYKPQLLEYYLPAPIQKFFNSRWIRIFQIGIICQALFDSPYLLEASGFSSMEELDQFLENHALREIPDHLVNPHSTKSQAHTREANERKEVIFAVSPGILTILLSIQLAVESSTAKANGIAAFWAETSKRLISYIQTLTDRPDLISCLQVATVHASPELIEGLINE